MNRKLISLIAIALIGTAGTLNAGMIVVSGDANITNGLVTGGGNPIEAGNQRFFSNVLNGGSTVLIDDGGDFFGGLFGGYINTYYNSLAGVSSSLLGAGTISGGTLSGVDLLATILPVNPYDAGELAAMSNFLNAGKSIFFIGDSGNAAFTNRNANINNALSGLGSSLSINNAFLDSGTPLFDAATGTQIASHALTEGVNKLTYSVASEVDTVSGGSGLFSSSNGTTFIAMESVATSVPDSGATVLLLGFGLLVLGAAKRRLC